MKRISSILSVVLLMVPPLVAQTMVTVPAGTRILVRTVEPIDTTQHKAGDRFTATLETDLEAEDSVVAPRGSKILARLASASSAGTYKGSSSLTLELTDIILNGKDYPLLTS